MLIDPPTAPKTKDSAQKASSGPTVSRIVAGRASGKRRLLGLMDGDLDTKRKKMLERDEEENVASPVLSHFFNNVAIAGPSQPNKDRQRMESYVLKKSCLSQISMTTKWKTMGHATKNLTRSLRRTDIYHRPHHLSGLARLTCLLRRDLYTHLGFFGVTAPHKTSPSTSCRVRRLGNAPVPLRSKSLSGRENEPFGCILVPDTPRKSRSAYPAGDQDADNVLCGPDLFEELRYS
jgi:hypothetical protein